MLKYIRNQCIGLVTLRIESNVLHALANDFTDPDSLENEVIDLGWLNEQLQAMPFLREIFIHIQVPNKESFYECQDLMDQSRELGWKLEVMSYERTGNGDDDYARYYKAAADLTNMECRGRRMQLGYQNFF